MNKLTAQTILGVAVCGAIVGACFTHAWGIATALVVFLFLVYA